MEFVMESWIKAPLAIHGGKPMRTKRPIVEQILFDQALFEVVKQGNLAGRKQQWLMSKPWQSRVERLPYISCLPFWH